MIYNPIVVAEMGFQELPILSADESLSAAMRCVTGSGAAMFFER
jgi:hypothetical protein